MRDEFRVMICLINLAHIDFEFHSREITWLRSLIDKYEFEKVDREKLFLEIQDPSGDFLDYFKEIRAVEYKEIVIEFSKVLFGLDGKYCDKEKEAYLKLKEVYSRLSGGDSEQQVLVGIDILKNQKSDAFYMDLKKECAALTDKSKRLFYIPFVSNGYIWSRVGSLFTGGKKRMIFGVLLILFFGGVFWFCLDRITEGMG